MMMICVHWLAMCNVSDVYLWREVSFVNFKSQEAGTEQIPLKRFAVNIKKTNTRTKTIQSQIPVCEILFRLICTLPLFHPSSFYHLLETALL